jgi:hypothetical protein
MSISENFLSHRVEVAVELGDDAIAPLLLLLLLLLSEELESVMSALGCGRHGFRVINATWFHILNKSA